MISIARKNLFHDHTRFIITVSGVAFVIGLILFSLGMLQGTIRQTTRHVENVDADIWVAEEGEDFYGFSKIPNHFIDIVRRTKGVLDLGTILLHPHSYKHDGQLSGEFTLVGYNFAGGPGGPWKLHEGKTVSADDELVLDYMYARDHGLKTGDTLLVNNPNEGTELPLRIVGLSDGTFNLRADYGFVAYATTARLFPIEGRTGFILIHTNDPQAVARRINAIGGLHAFTKKEMKDTIISYWGKVMGMGMGATSLITFLVGMVIVGLTLYTAVMEKTREYGVLKAIGATNRFLYRVIAEQAVVIAVIGFAGGVILSQVFYRLFLLVMPKMELTMPIFLLAGIFILTVVMCLTASFLSRRQMTMTRIDPLIVFKA